MNIEDEINSNEPVDHANICMIIVEYYKTSIFLTPKLKKKIRNYIKKIKPNFRSFRIKHISTQIQIFIMLLNLF